MYQRVTGGNVIFVVVRLAFQDRGNITDAANVVQTGKRPINPVEQDEMAGIIHEAAHPFQHSLCGSFVEVESLALRDGRKVQRTALEPQLEHFQDGGDRAPKEK